MPTPNTADAMKRHKAGKAGFTDKAHLKAKGLIPRADGTKRKSDKYKEEDIYGKQDSKLMGTVTMVHNTSGKEIVVFDDPNVVKNKEKLGFKVQKEQKEETYQLTERDLLKLINKTGFSKADFKTNENDNDHSLNAIMLARAFGTPQEFKDMINIDKRHKERGSITEPDYQERNALVKKYYPRLK